MRVPDLETARLTIRRFTADDLDAIHQILDVELGDADFGSEGPRSRDERWQWLQWTILGYEELAKLHQPPYGERAVVLKASSQVIGACGFVPCLDPFGQIPSLSRDGRGAPGGPTSTEFGLFYAIARAHRRRGYATEAARCMIDYAFGTLHLRHIVATTTRDNVGSISVMRHLRMRIEENPYPDPPWLQVVGILDKTERS
jgi:ribosomal-protein-alanine N-acetyltransferase